MKTKKGPQPFVTLATEIDDRWRDMKRQIGASYANEFSVTGQPYETLEVETERDLKLAFEAGISTFNQFAGKHRVGTLFWHSIPTIEEVGRGKSAGYLVKLRLLISDNPIVSRMAADAAVEAQRGDIERGRETLSEGVVKALEMLTDGRLGAVLIVGIHADGHGYKMWNAGDDKVIDQVKSELFHALPLPRSKARVL